MIRWEYKTVVNLAEFLPKIEKELNELGGEGWDIVYTTHVSKDNTDTLIFILKREKIEETKPFGEFTTQEIRQNDLVD